ncbi:unnamed protein product [Effrenium voratum]|nr:unnamed protein product [Effrenium voratum]
MGPNSGGGRRNQAAAAASVPTRAIFSNKGSGSGKGKDGKGKEKGKREPRQNFQSQKEMDKVKGKGKTSTNLSPAEAHIAAAAARAAGGIQQEAMSIWERAGDPSYIHGCFYLTRDDHLALEPLLTPLAEAVEASCAQLPTEIIDASQEHLKELGFQDVQSRNALTVVGRRLCKEFDERDASVTDKAAAERALEWICCTSAETSLPSRLKEPREVTTARRLQEEKNVAFQTKALLHGGQIEGTHITRIEKLGFSRARAIQALAEAPDHQLLPAVKSLLAEFLPLDLPPGTEPDSAAPASPEELMEEVEAMQSIYGEENVQTFGQAGLDGFELLVKLPASGIGGGGGRWTMAFMIPGGLLYPHVSPLLCPRHDRLREANRPRLMQALGEVCEQALGAPMFFILCEWLQENGPRFLVLADSDKQELSDADAMQRSQRDLAEQRIAEAQTKEKEEGAEKAKRIELLQQMMEEESRAKDKIAAQIRSTPETAQYDLAGYEEPQVKALVKDAFATPLETEGKMIRVTFVVGGGKTVRSKYSESLARFLGTSLQDIGFAQDSAASNDLLSAGTFKGQHDTQRNLKLVHVFPKVTGGDGASTSGKPETVRDTCQRVSAAPWEDFVDEVGPWLRTKDSKVEALLTFLEESQEELQETELAFQQGKHVSEARRRRYDELGSAEDVAERIRWLRGHEESSRPVRNGDSDGATLAFDAPSLTSRIQEAEPAENAQGEQADDAAWLQRRLAQTRSESQKLQVELSRERPLQKTRESLPAYTQRDVIQAAVLDAQVVVIEGDTGCGKSTQVPQFIFEDWLAKGQGGAASIIMTQPRRISAIGVADRIANEMNTGLGDLVGYSIRMESKRSARTKILVCTTGVLLRRLENDPQLHGVTHIIVDECHERDLDTDFLLIILRDLLPKRPRLRIVLMSATINAQIFKDYFPGSRSICIPGRTFPVTAYFMEHALMHTGLVIEPHSEYCRKDVDPILTYQEEQELRQIYEKPENAELLSGTLSKHVLQQLHRVDPEKINFDLVAQVVNHIHTQVDPCKDGKSPGAILVFVPGLREIKKAIRCINQDAADVKGYKGKGFDDRGKGSGKGGPEVTKDGLWVLPLHSMISVNEQRLVFKRPPSGARKVVVTTNIAETSITIDDVEYVIDCGRHKQTKYDPQNRISMLVDCVETKANAKQRRGRAGRVKPGVCYHLVNVRKWRRMDDFEKPEMLRVPLDSLCLRVSLMGMGHPAKILAKAITPPTDAAVLSSLQQLVELSAVELRERVAGAAEEIGANGWDKDDQQRLLKAKLRLTPLGNHLAQLPVDAGSAKLLVLGCIFGIPRDVCTLAASLSVKSPFAVNADGKGNGKGVSEQRKLDFAGDLESDQLLLVKLFEHWEQLGKHSQAARTWCRENSLDIQAFETVSEMRRHLLGIVVDQGFASREQTEAAGRQAISLMPACLSSVVNAKEEFNRRRFQLMRTLLCAALWPNVMLLKDNGTLFARNAAALGFHSSSILALQADQLNQDNSGDWTCPQCQFYNFASRQECRSCWAPKSLSPPRRKAKPLRHRSFMFAEKVRSLASGQGQKSQTLCRDCSGVSLKALFLLGHRVDVDFLKGRMSVDKWIHCQAAARDASMLLGMRRRLQDVLTRRLAKIGVQQAADTEVVNVMTQMLVLDVE